MLSLGVRILGNRVDKIMQSINVAIKIGNVTRIINRDQVITTEFLRQILEIIGLADYSAPFTRCVKVVFVLASPGIPCSAAGNPTDRES